MRTTGWKTCAALGVSLSIAATPLVAAETQACLRYDQLQQLSVLDNKTATATSNRQAYRVTFKGVCWAKASAAFFVLNRDRLGPCLDAGDILDVSDNSTPCVVDQVTLLPSVEVRFGRPVQ